MTTKNRALLTTTTIAIVVDILIIQIGCYPSYCLSCRMMRQSVWPLTTESHENAPTDLFNSKATRHSVSEVMGYLKGKSSLIIFEKHANLKYKYGNRHFWCRGYYVDTVGKNTAAIKQYIQNQLKEDLEYDQMSLVEYIDPFTGEPVKKNKK